MNIEDHSQDAPTQDLAQEVVVFSAATTGWFDEGRWPRRATHAHASEFPHLTAPTPLRLRLDEEGFYEMVLTYYGTGTEGEPDACAVGHVRRQWALEQGDPMTLS
jgi:hypothetical protein